MTTVIDLFGGPGIGKSTLAAKIFVALKEAGANVELVTEYVKQWAWENRKPIDYDQFYFFGHQARREYLLFNKVDYVVTDCPVMLISYYAQKLGTPEQAILFKDMYSTYLKMCNGKGHSHINYVLKRCYPYQIEGRYHSEKEALEIDDQIEQFIQESGVEFKEIKAADESINIILKDLKIR